ncbi:peptidase [Lysobacteraceae bacterium NML71-0210]|nr:peptidase [Xanthomonadaceae bacterium NML71-0210]
MTSNRRFLRPALLSTACMLALSALTLPAQESRLPDMGSSAARILSPAKQNEYGAMMLAQLRHYGYTLDDPLLNQWLQGVGQRLAAASDRPEQPFTFFLLKERQINAFATLGGYIGTNAGLILAAEREDEMAAVLSHEIAHVTQTHVLRAVERAQRDQIPILLGMLAAIMVAQQSNSASSGDATMAAVMGAQGLIIQRQIDYTRSNESEADRLGIRTLARSGYDPEAMAAFFERMQASSRANQGSEESRLPDYLRTHPVTTTRIAEAKTRAERLPARTHLHTPHHQSANPLLPGGIKLDIAQSTGTSGDFAWARERLRVLSAASAREAIGEYQRMARTKPLDEAARYGLALAKIRANQAASAREDLAKLALPQADNRWIQLALAEAEAHSGQLATSDQRFERLRLRYPNDPAVAISAATVLLERGNNEAARRALAILRPLLGSSAHTPAFQRIFARANEMAGDWVRAGEAYAEAEYLNGNPERALLQLNTLLRRPDLDYYARARIEARIIAITPLVEELRRLGMTDKTLER